MVLFSASPIGRARDARCKKVALGPRVTLATPTNSCREPLQRPEETAITDRPETLADHADLDQALAASK
jgi:hypothetical protein